MKHIVDGADTADADAGGECTLKIFAKESKAEG